MGSRLSLLTMLGYAEIGICLAALSFILLRKNRRDYWALASLLAVRALTGISLAFLLGIRGRHVEIHTAYKLYFYIYWLSFAIESVLVLFILYGVYRVTMAPLKGLQTLGMLIFRWVAAISVFMALTSAFAPHITGTKALVAAISQLLRTQSILTFGLVLFIVFATRPMGLSYRSKTFGVAVGLAIMAMTDLVQSLWIDQTSRMYSLYSSVNGFALCAAMGLWTIYLALPEPKRRLVVLPTTSPLLRWNQLALALFSDEQQA